MIFKIFIQKELLASGLSKKDFSLRVGISRKVLNDYLSGESAPNIDKATTIAKVLGKDIQIIDPYSEDNTIEI